MSEQCYLGVDLGAESGRVMAGLWDGERIRLEELHRFPNGGVEIGGTLRWDVLRLWSEIQHGPGLPREDFRRHRSAIHGDQHALPVARASEIQPRPTRCGRLPSDDARFLPL